jgi:hypothetical protein
MIKISIEVRSSAARFKVALLAESIEGALEMAKRYNPGKECKVCSLSTQRSSSSDEAAWYGCLRLLLSPAHYRRDDERAML